MLVGFSGKAGSGKDTAADYLVAECGFVKLSFAAKLKDLAANLNPTFPEFYASLQVLLLEADWDTIKELPYTCGDRTRYPVREFLQTLGVACRDTFGENFWADQLISSMDSGVDYVISDVRFPNEHRFVKVRSGQVWRLEGRMRDSVKNSNHVSEQPIAADAILDNSGTIEDLQKQVYRLLMES